MRKKILILAKSYKHRKNGEFGKCIAGIINQDGKYRWVRLVADKDGNSVPDSNFPYETLDIVEADIEPCPLNNQIENHTFSNVRKNSSITNEQLKSIFARIPHSFFGSMSNMFDGVPKNSLTIFLASDIRIYWEEKNDKKKQKMDFRIGNNKAMGVSMTAPGFYTDKERNEERNIPLAICVASLPSEPIYNKFIAGIFPIDSYTPSY